MGQTTLNDSFSSNNELDEYQDNNTTGLISPSIYPNDQMKKFDNILFDKNIDENDNDIFPFPPVNILNLEKSKYSDNFLSEEKSTSPQNSKSIPSSENQETVPHRDIEIIIKKKVFFEVKKVKKIIEKKTSGRKRHRFDNIYYKPHTKNCQDNVLRKLNVGYLQFIILFLNSIIQYLNFKNNKEYLFKKLYYEYIKVIKKERILENLKKTIGQLIKEIPISTKYNLSEDSEKDHNKKLVVYYSESSEIMKNVLNGNFLSLFPIYYNSKRKVNLSEFGKNEDLILSENVKLYKDLIEKGDNSKDDYKKICEAIIKSQFSSK